MEHARTRFRHATRAGNTHATHAASTRTRTLHATNNTVTVARAAVRAITQATVETRDHARQALLVYFLRLRVREHHMLAMRTPAPTTILRLRATTLHTTITTSPIHELHATAHQHTL